MEKTYTLSTQQVLQNLGVDEKGLSTAQAQERLQKYGPNKLREKKKKTTAKAEPSSDTFQNQAKKLLS